MFSQRFEISRGVRHLDEDQTSQNVLDTMNKPFTKKNWLLVWLPSILFSHMLGISSSQLTNSYFSEGWPNHQPKKSLGEGGSKLSLRFHHSTDTAAQHAWHGHSVKTWMICERVGSWVWKMVGQFWSKSYLAESGVSIVNLPPGTCWNYVHTSFWRYNISIFYRIYSLCV